MKICRSIVLLASIIGGTLCPLQLASAEARTPRIVFLGDSLTAGLGLDVDEAYPALIQSKLDETGRSIKVVNAGVSADTTAGGVRRIDWLLREPLDLLVIALGANDGLRGLDIEAMKTNLRTIIEKTRARCPEATIVLAGMLVPPNQGQEYADRYAKAFGEVARETNVQLMTFLLEGVAGRPEMNQTDGIHPTAGGQRVIAETVWRTVQPLLSKCCDLPARCSANEP